MLAENGILDVSGGCTNVKNIYLKSEQTGRPIQLILGCHNRYDCMCPACADKWRRKNRKRFQKVMWDWDSEKIRMLTLTLKKDYREQPVVDRIKELWKYRKELFRNLRERGYWIGGWIAAVEPPNHIHIVMESDFIPQTLIKEEWQKITGDSYYVYINQWKNVRDMKRFSIYYLTKYLTKLGGVKYETAIQMKGFHLVGSSMGPHKKEKPEEQEEKEHWVRIDRLEFEAIFLDFYDKVTFVVTNADVVPPGKQKIMDLWAGIG